MTDSTVDRVVDDGTQRPELGRNARGVRVLGMHRSGTSYLAGSFASAGYFIGDEPMLMGPGPDNQRGFFERQDVCRLNDVLLAGVGASWHSPPDPGVVRVHRPRMTAEIGALFGAIAEDASGNPIVLKDPRLCLLLPAWDAVCGDELVNVLVTRNPLDIAASLQRRNAFPVHFSLALWQLYSVSLLNALQGRFVLVAHFDRMAQSREERSRWTQDAGRELRRLGLPFPDLDGFAASDKHFRSREDELFELASPDQLRLWRFVQELEAVEQHLSVPQEFLQWPTSAATLVLEVAGLIGENAGFSHPHQSAGPEPDLINLDVLALAHADIERLRLDLVGSERERDLLMAESAAAVRAADEAAAVSDAAERRVVEVSESLLQSEIINDRVSRQLKKELDSLHSEVGEENLRLQSSLRDEVTRRKATEASLHSLSGELAIVRSGALETELAAQLASEHFTLTLASIVNSRSWRLTRPLRALFRLSRGGKPRGA